MPQPEGLQHYGLPVISCISLRLVLRTYSVVSTVTVVPYKVLGNSEPVLCTGTFAAMMIVVVAFRSPIHERVWPAWQPVSFILKSPLGMRQYDVFTVSSSPHLSLSC